MAAVQSADGQFDDAPENDVPTVDPRAGATFIDDPLLEWSEPEDDGEEVLFCGILGWLAQKICLAFRHVAFVWRVI